MILGRYCIVCYIIFLICKLELYFQIYFHIWNQLLGQLRGGEAALRQAEGRGAAVEVSWRGHAVHPQPGHRGRQRQEQPRDLGLVRGDGSVASLQPGAESRSLGHEAGPRPQRGEVLYGGLHPGHGLETLCA